MKNVSMTLENIMKEKAGSRKENISIKVSVIWVQSNKTFLGHKLRV
jgi:hypothetical protein